MLERNSSFVLQEKRREGWRLKASVKVNRKKLLLILCRLRCTNTNLPPWKSVWVVSAQKDKMSTGFVLFVLFLSFLIKFISTLYCSQWGRLFALQTGYINKKTHNNVTTSSCNKTVFMVQTWDDSVKTAARLCLFLCIWNAFSPSFFCHWASFSFLWYFCVFLLCLKLTALFETLKGQSVDTLKHFHRDKKKKKKDRTKVKLQQANCFALFL